MDDSRLSDLAFVTCERAGCFGEPVLAEVVKELLRGLRQIRKRGAKLFNYPNQVLGRLLVEQHDERVRRAERYSVGVQQRTREAWRIVGRLRGIRRF